MKSIVEHLATSFPHFSGELKSKIIAQGKLKELEAGEVLMSIGQKSKLIPLITSGLIKVMREDDEGNELFLYYLHPGQTCALSLNCMILSQPSEVFAVAEEDTVLIALSPEQIGNWISEYADWSTFVIGTYQMRFKEMLHTIDGIAFKQLDQRLYAHIVEKSTALQTKTIQVTHQELADDLHSSREVISRLLKILEKQRKIELGRNKITLL